MHGDKDPCECDYCQMGCSEGVVHTDGKPIEEQWFYTDDELVAMQSKAYNQGLETGLIRGFCWGLVVCVIAFAMLQLVSDLSK